LFVTFKGEETPLTEQVYFGLSRDGRHWQALNGAEPILVSELGEKGVRDAFLLRSHDDQKFFLLATDLSIYHDPDWDAAALLPAERGHRQSRHVGPKRRHVSGATAPGKKS